MGSSKADALRGRDREITTFVNLCAFVAVLRQVSGLVSQGIKKPGATALGSVRPKSEPQPEGCEKESRLRRGAARCRPGGDFIFF